MNGKSIVVTEFLSVSKPVNHKNQNFYMNRRTSSALIFPISGKIEFSWGEHVVYTDNENPVFIPEGMCYRNKCIEDAKSIMINIRVQNVGTEIIRILPPDNEKLKRTFDEITVLNTNPTVKKQIKIFEKIYELICECLPDEEGDRTSLLSSALEYIEKNYHDSELNLDNIAKYSNISKPYLHKLFKKEFGMTPFGYITQKRMIQAKILLMEMYPVGEVATMVGYSDIYQFSRAFKRFYNFSPKKIRKR